MGITRRTALRTLAAAAGTAVMPRAVRGEGRRGAAPDAVGVLYDPVRCIGCKQCVRACAAENNGDEALATVAEARLSPAALTVLQRYEVGAEETFRKVQCMHCVDPACAAACPLGAMHQDGQGAVVWNADLCIGCRYCEVACPFVVPRFQWDTPAPVMRKCELCKQRRARGQEPACTSACRMGALTYGTRAELLREAHRRIAESPGLYGPKVFGEHDAGGTKVLYLAKAGVPFTAMGLPRLGTSSVPSTPERVQHAIYRGFAAPLALYGVLAMVVHRNTRLQSAAEKHEARSEPVGGRLLTWPVATLLLLTVLGFATVLWRFAAGLGATTNLSDGYPFGLWITLDVVVGTALACGGYAVALLVYVANRGQYHPLVRSAIVTSALGYTLGGLSVLVDLGRPWNFYKIPLLIGNWNLNSILLEVAICIMCYTTVLWVELSPAFLEQWRVSRLPVLRRFAAGMMPHVQRALPGLIAIGLLLPTMHQSSLGGLMMLSGSKLHPFWQTTLLPLLFLVSCVGMGYGAVTLECCLSARAFRRPDETHMLRALAGPMALVLFAYLALRIADVYHRVGFAPVARLDGDALLFLGELALFALPMLGLFFARRRASGGWLACLALLVIAAGALYRFSTYLIAFNPGPQWSYFPSVAELAVSVGFISFELLAYTVLVKRFPVLRGATRPAAAGTPSQTTESEHGSHRLAGTAATAAGLALLLAAGPLRAQNYGHFDARCLTNRPQQCLKRPLPRNEPHKAICATCHDLWKEPSPRAAARSCTRAGCHERPVTLNAFHRHVTAEVLSDCIRCHPAHNARLTVGHAKDCVFCHSEGGKRPPLRRASSLH